MKRTTSSTCPTTRICPGSCGRDTGVGVGRTTSPRWVSRPTSLGDLEVRILAEGFGLPLEVRRSNRTDQFGPTSQVRVPVVGQGGHFVAGVLASGQPWPGLAYDSPQLYRSRHRVMVASLWAVPMRALRERYDTLLGGAADNDWTRQAAQPLAVIDGLLDDAGRVETMLPYDQDRQLRRRLREAYQRHWPGPRIALWATSRRTGRRVAGRGQEAGADLARGVGVTPRPIPRPNSSECVAGVRGGRCRGGGGGGVARVDRGDAPDDPAGGHGRGDVGGRSGRTSGRPSWRRPRQAHRLLGETRRVGPAGRADHR